MSAIVARNAYNEANDRQAETLVTTERWWKDRYNDIANQGYMLHPRYHPEWEPSWFKTKKDTSTVEGGQVTMVRVVAFLSFTFH